MIDFSNMEGITDAQKTAILAQVKGLKDKNDTLIQDQKATKLKSEKLEKEALIAADKAVDSAKTMEEVKTARDNFKTLAAAQEAKVKQQKEEFQVERDKNLLGSTVKDLLASKVIKDPAAQMYMQNRLQGNLEVQDGKVIPKDKSLTMEQYQTNVLQDKAHSAYVVASQGSGGGATGNNGNGQAGAKSITREQHDTMAPLAVAQHIRDGGTVIN